MGDGVRQPGDFSAARRLHPTEPGGSIGLIYIHTIKEQHVEMDIEVQRRAKALDESDSTRPGPVVCIACFPDQMGSDDAMDDAQHPPHDLRPAGEQETQLVRETQYPLAHGLFGQYFVNQQGRAFGHATCTTARAEPSSFAAESNQVLGMAGLAAHPQKTMFQPAAFEKFLKFPLHTLVGSSW